MANRRNSGSETGAAEFQPWDEGLHSSSGAAAATSRSGATNKAGLTTNDDDDGHTLNGTPDDDTLNGNGGDDTLNGLAGNDTLNGGAGNDVLNGGTGNDTMAGGNDDDTYILDNIADQVVENVGGGIDRVIASFNVDLTAGAFAGQEIENVVLTGKATTAIGNAAANLLIGTDGANLLDGGGADDRLVGGKGNDTYVLSKDGLDEVFELRGEGIDTLNVSNDIDLSQDWRFSKQEIENLTAVAGNGDLVLIGNALNNVLTGAEGNDTLAGGKGNDTLVGNDGDDTLDGGIGADTLIGGAGNDQYIVDDAGDKIVETTKSSAPGKEDADTVVSDISFSLAGLANVENLTLRGETQTENLNAIGNALANHLNGNVGDNVLDGGAGIDFFDGVGGYDTFIIDNIAELANIVSDGGDTVKTALLLKATDVVAGVDNYIYTGKSNWTFDLSAFTGVDHKLVGSTGSDTLTGSNANDFLDGGKGNDALAGGAGDDTYIVDSLGDTVTDTGGSGDTVVINRSLDLVNGTGKDAQFVGVIENVTLIGTSALNAFGDDGDNTLTGNDGANFLDGRGGINTLIGGNGNDSYIVKDISDAVVEKEGGGIDTIYTADSVSLESYDNVENLIALPSATSVDFSGNTLNNVLVGTDGEDRLIGGEGNDTLVGGKGSDVYWVDSSGDKVVETVSNIDGGGDDDTINSFVDFSLAKLSNVETLVLWDGVYGTGNALNNTLVGNYQDNVLDGGAGIDTFTGGQGNDTYVIDHLEELGNISDAAPWDTIQTGLLLKSSDVFGAVIGNYTYTGKSNWVFDLSSFVNDDHKLVGGSGSDTLTGANTTDWLDGGAGADTLTGGEGSDTYVIDNVSDKVIETGSSNAYDTIVINRTVDLSDNSGLNAQFFGVIEYVTLSGKAALNATGDDGDNTLIGNDGANTLDGGAGADSLVGGKGNDTYILSGYSDDSIEELDGGGIDTIKVSFDYDLDNSLGDNVKVENLSALLAVDKVQLGGNALDNTLTGTDFDDVLDGHVGNDTLIGGKGSDLYIVDSLGDKVIESTAGATGGIDEVQSTSSFSIAAFGNVENLTLLGTDDIDGTGNASINTLIGNSGDNVLDGGKGIDIYDGGTGDDTYVIDNIAELGKITDADGSDTIKTGLLLTAADAIYDPNNNISVENYTYTGSAKWVFDLSGLVGYDHKLTGGSGADVLTGADGFDVLDGGKGNDILTGGDGDDTYIVDSLGDVVNETGTGLDSIIGNRSVNLLTDFQGNIENATLTGSAALDAGGNDADNILIGNDGANKITGLAGADFIRGGKGDDTLSGGTDADIFDYNAVSDRGTGKEVITDFDIGAGDQLDFSNLLDSIGSGSGSGVFNDGWLNFVDDGKGNTIVELDADGGGDDFVTLVTLVGTTLTQDDSGSYILA